MVIRALVVPFGTISPPSVNAAAGLARQHELLNTVVLFTQSVLVAVFVVASVLFSPYTTALLATHTLVCLDTHFHHTHATHHTAMPTRLHLSTATDGG
jgi:hypothetical protein